MLLFFAQPASILFRYIYMYSEKRILVFTTTFTTNEALVIAVVTSLYVLSPHSVS